MSLNTLLPSYEDSMSYVSSCAPAREYVFENVIRIIFIYYDLQARRRCHLGFFGRQKA